MKLPETQLAVLEAAGGTTDRPIDEVAAAADLKPAAATRAAFELEADGLVNVTESEREHLDLTDEGETYLDEGLPELRLYRAAEAADAADEPVDLGRLLGDAGLEGPAVDIALSNFARKGYGDIDGGAVAIDPDADPGADAEAAALAAVADSETEAIESDALEAGVVDSLVDRNLVDRTERTDRGVRRSDEGTNALMEGVEVAATVDRVTPELLTSGEWRDVEFAEYNVAADAEETPSGRTHVLRQMADRVKDVLVGMGFQEMRGPHVDADFWINDCLFMPQDHPARNHWDRFALSQPEEIDDLPPALVERVRSAHREGVGPDGEGYHSPWDEDFARKLALRGHTTSLSARHLAGEALGDLEPPQRFFSVEKAYRNDTLDATHLLEFFQIEGWVMAEDLSVRDLFGTFTAFYEQFGITDLQFKPHYNPYTEPSFELFGRHPETGDLIEIGNSGIFREEMLEPLGVDCDVMAWGLALERLMMLATGAEDIRDVHGTLVDLEYLRTEEVLH
jgi:phenylalanyl-tRNA synthetase alpha chain